MAHTVAQRAGGYLTAGQAVTCSCSCCTFCDARSTCSWGQGCTSYWHSRSWCCAYAPTCLAIPTSGLSAETRGLARSCACEGYSDGSLCAIFSALTVGSPQRASCCAGCHSGRRAPTCAASSRTSPWGSSSALAGTRSSLVCHGYRTPKGRCG